MIAITFALPIESSGVLGKLERKRVQPIPPYRLTTGNFRGRQVAVFHTGVGSNHAELAIETVLSAIQPRILISSGFAGSVVDGLNVGDVVIAENFSDIQLAQTLMERRAPAMSRGVAASPELRLPSYQRLHCVKLHTVKSMIHSAEDRRRIARQYGAGAIDMESEEIAKVCAAHSIPMLSLRVISDSLTAPFPAPPGVLFDLASQKTDFGKLIRYVLRHPSAIPRLAGFARQTSRARELLTEELLDLIARI